MAETSQNLTPILIDAPTQREHIRNKVVEGIKQVFPIQSKNYSIELGDLKLYPAQFSSREQKQAILEGRSLHEPIKGSLTVKDKDGKIVSQSKGLTLVHLPYFTNRHTFIVDGNEYNISNQIRIKPGVYTRRRGNAELEAAFNLSKGDNFRLSMDPDEGLLNIEYGTSKIPLYPVLHALGVPHADIAKNWGGSVADTNKAAYAKNAEKHVQKLYSRLLYPTQQTHTLYEDKVNAIRQAYDETRMDPEVTKKTLGHAYDKVTPHTLLAASTKLLNVHKAAEDTDDRDSLEFKTFHSVDDFFKERIGLDSRMLKRKIAMKLDQAKGDLRRAMPPAPLTRSIRSFITSANLSGIPMQINPMELIDHAVKVTSLGEGGISSERAVPLEARNLHPTHFGILDPIRTPECHSYDTEVLTKNGWKFWPNVTMNDELACNIQGVLEFHKPEKLYASQYTGKMYGVKTGKISYLVTPNHRMWVRPYAEPNGSKYRFASAEDIHNKNRTFNSAHLAYIGNSNQTTFTLPTFNDASDNRCAKTYGPYDMSTWATFMGWFLSEGSVTFNESRYDYLVKISQNKIANPDCCLAIEENLTKLGVSWTYSCNAYQFGSKQFAFYLKQFGYCYDKFIPEYFFDADIESRSNLLNALLLGDGRIISTRKGKPAYTQEVFTTTSRKLADDFERLAMSLGKSVTIKIYKDNREERYLDVYEVRILQHDERTALRKKEHYFTLDYNGPVYCATVPGGLLYTRRGATVPIWSGNSGKAGVDIRASSFAHRDKEGNLYSVVRNVKTNKLEYLKPSDLMKLVVAFPGEDLSPGRIVDVIHNGKVEHRPSSEVTHFVPHSAFMYGPTTNLLPLLNGMQGNRSIMASKHQSQALPLIDREAPNVQVKSHLGNTFERQFAKMIVPTAPVDGIITKIDKDYIHIQPIKQASVDTSFFSDDDVYNDFVKIAEDGTIKLHYDDHFPLAAKTYLHNSIKVKEGDRVSAGQPLADSNFTKNDTLALGKNLSVAYLAYRGLNSNDGVVISEGASKKLTSEHMYKSMLELDPDTLIGKEKHRTYFGNKYLATHYKNLDDNGIVKPGTKVNPEDILIAAIRKTQVSAEAAMLGRLSKSLIKPYKDAAILWNHEHPGEVIDVVKTPGRITITVKTSEIMGIGDKLSNRFGGKGVVSKIIPDNQMIHDESGKPIDVLFTAAGISSRINPAQLIEGALGKVAHKTGKPVEVENFGHENYVQYAREMLKKHGLKDKETVFDPVSGKHIPGVFVGRPYILKLFKTTDSNWSAHGVRNYDLNQQPARGGDEGAKGIGKMEFDGLVSHNARNILQEAASIKSNRNDEFWRAVQLGLPTPAPKAPFAYDKFLNMLQGAGIKVDKQGNRLALGPLTDNDISKFSSGPIKAPKFLRAKDLMPEPSGFFDPALTGGTSGTKWSHVNLAEPIVNPVFEEPVRRLLGLTQKEFDRLHGEKGGNHFKQELDKIDVDKKIEELLKTIKTAKGAILDNAVKQVKYLRALKEQKLTPSNAYVVSKMPVTPPIIRPVLPDASGNLQISDVNLLYRDAFLANDKLRESKTSLPEDLIAPLRSHLYQAVGAVYGINDPVSPNAEKRLAKGYINMITGSNPGSGFFQAKLLKRQQDVSGRATIAPDPTLSLDEIGIPEDMLWTMYEKFIIGRLVRKGYPAVTAQTMVKERHPAAKTEFQLEVNDRPVIVNRAPSLHRFNILAAYARPIPGKTIKLNPFAETGTNADYDGDAMQVHAPVTAAGIEDAKNMTLSKLLFLDKYKNALNVAPQMEAVIGLHRATAISGSVRPKRTFKTKADAMAAYKSGELDLNDPIEIQDTK